MKRKNVFLFMVFLALTTLLTACGGGGGGAASSAPGSYTVGGIVSGLTGSGLVLQNNGADDLSISSSGPFTFSTAVAYGGAYHVTVKTQPSNPSQTCTASANSGLIAGSNVTDVSVVCATNTYTVGGTISGLAGGKTIVLQNNGADDKTISANGTFSFATAVADGAGFNVTVKTQPSGQTCTPNLNTGTMEGADVTSVTIACSSNSYTVGGSVTGMIGGTLVLQDNGSDDKMITANGSFTFPTPVVEGADYNVTVKTQPALQTCTVNNDVGTINGSNVDTVGVSCTQTAYTIGGTVSGLSGTVVLKDNNSDTVSVSASGGFTFTNALASGASYSVSVASNPTGQVCSVSNGSGTVPGANVTNVSISCQSVYKVWADVTGLSGSFTYYYNNGYPAAIGSNGMTYLGTVVNGGGYNVEIQFQPSGQTCTPANGGTGTVNGADAIVTISCVTNTYSLGGTQSGLIAGRTLVLQNNSADDLIVTDATFTFATKIEAGAPYSVSVKTQPVGQVCSLSNKTGVMPAANVSTVSVTCSSNNYSVGGMASGVAGVVELQDNFGDTLAVTVNGAFTIAPAVADGSNYSVTVKSSGATQYCSVTNGNGTVSAGNVTDVQIACSPVTQHLAYVTIVAGKLVPYPIDASTGSILSAPVNTTAVKGSQFSAITPNGKFVYLPDASYKTVSAYSIDSGTGAASYVASYATGTAPQGLAVDPTSTYLYVANFGASSVSGFTIDGTTGALTPVSGSPFTTDTQPLYVTINPAGTHVYVLNQSKSVSVFAIGAGGSLTPIAGSPFPTTGMSTPRGFAISADGKYAYMADGSVTGLFVFNIDGTGALSGAISGSPFPTATRSVYASPAFDPTGNYLYSTNWGDGVNPGSLGAYSVNTSTGAVTQLAGSPYPVGPRPQSVLVDTTGRFVYVVNQGSISVFTRDAGTGKLSAAPGSPFAVGSNNLSLVVTP